MVHPLRAPRAWLLAAVFLSSLLASAAVVRRFLPFPEVEGIDEKLKWLDLHGAEYDTLFVGSSRILYHIIPSEFDAAMAQAGQPTRSFNFGSIGMRSPEDSYVLEQALGRRKAPLRFVLVEAEDITLKIRDEVAGTSRLDYWHDPSRMRALVGQALSAGEAGASEWANLDEQRDAFRRLGLHLLPFLKWATNTGRGERFVSLVPPVPREWKHWVGPRGDGFTEEKIGGLNRRETKSLLSKLDKGFEPPQVAVEASQRLYADMERRIAASGARMFVVVPPRIDTGRVLPDPTRFPHVPIFDFSDPSRYPDLFDPRYRYDSDHLNKDGAAIFTRLLAARMIEAGESGKGF